MVPYLNLSITTLLNAACCRFFTLIQRSNRPPRYGLSRGLLTNPSSPISQACRNALLKRCRVDAIRPPCQ